MKKILSLVLVVVMICSTFAGLQIGTFAATYTGSCGPNARYSLNTSTGVLSISGSGAMTSNDYFDIGTSPGITNQNYIKTVTVASGITEICYGAFQYCGNLTSVSLPNTLKKIGSFAFFECNNLTSLIIPNSVTEIGSAAFCGSGIKELEIPVNVSKIGQEAFAGMTNLESFIWNANNPEIDINLNGSSLFDGTGKNVSGGTTLTFGSSCKKLDYGHYILESIMENQYDSDRKNYIGTINVNHHINGSLSIGSAYLTQTINVYSHIDDFESYIKEYSETGDSPTFLYGNKKTKGITVNVLNGSNTLPNISNYYDSSVIDKSSFILNYNDYNNLEIIPSTLFYKLSSSGVEKTFGSNKLEKVKCILNGAFSNSSIDFVPKNVEYIGSEAFKNCSQLKTIYFSKNLKTINYCAFDNCTNLKEIYYEGTRADWEQIAIARQSSSAYSEYDYFSKAVVHCSDEEHEKPIGSIASTNNVTSFQTATLTLSDNVGVAGYYWGTNSNYASNTYTTASAGNITKTISSAGTYYLTVKNTSGNISDTVSVTYYKTTLNANGGSVSPTSVLTQSGKAFAFPTPTRSGYTYQGWSTTSSATSGVKSLTPNGNTTYYVIWKQNEVADTTKPTGSISSTNNVAASQTATLTLSDNKGVSGGRPAARSTC